MEQKYAKAIRILAMHALAAVSGATLATLGFGLLDKKAAPSGALFVSGDPAPKPIGLVKREAAAAAEPFTHGLMWRVGEDGPYVRYMCAGGYQFLMPEHSGRSPVQILNAGGGGIPCKAS